MHVIQILLPLSDNAGIPFCDAALDAIHQELTDRFGGLTAFTRAPAEGVWAHDGQHAKDDIVVIEVMTDEIDRDWWGAFRQRVERELSQERLIVRAQPTELL
jgi:hypothetical protein